MNDDGSTTASRLLRGVRDLIARGMHAGPRVIRFEQAVYGSFAFRDQGYAFLAQSPGCRPEWLAEFRAACQRIGERPAMAVEASGLFSLRLACGIWAVVGISPQGRDDRGRPGALGFHGLFLTSSEYRNAGSSPFPLTRAHRSGWTAETRTMAAGSLVVDPSPRCALLLDPRAERLALAIARGRRVAIESPAPIDAIAQGVWERLPPRVRARASVATWAFGNDNHFHLLAVPRLAGISLDATYDCEVEPQSAQAIGEKIKA